MLAQEGITGSRTAGALPAGMVTGGNLISAVAYGTLAIAVRRLHVNLQLLLAGKVEKSSLRRPKLCRALCKSALFCWGWALYLAIERRQQGYSIAFRYLWMPLCPEFVLSVVEYIHFDLFLESIERLRMLRSFTYNFQQA